MKNLVTAKWLKDNLSNEKLVIVDCRFNLMDKEYGKRSYEEGHIEGSVRVDLETELSAPVKKHGGRHPLPTDEQLKEIRTRLGLRNENTDELPGEQKIRLYINKAPGDFIVEPMKTQIANIKRIFPEELCSEIIFY